MHDGGSRAAQFTRYQANVAITSDWQRDAARPAGEDASVPAASTDGMLKKKGRAEALPFCCCDGVLN